MNNKRLIIICCISVLVASIIQFAIWFAVSRSNEKKFNNTVTQLQSTINAFGTMVNCYTVNIAVKPGDKITDENLQTMQVPSSYVSDSYITNASDITGKYFKVTVTPGTPISTAMVMNDELADDMREHDIMLDSWPVGIKEGDYVDMRITMPYGMDYVVISHCRVNQVNELTCKVNLTELEWNKYKGAMVDYALNKEYGCTVYAIKYIEPGVQQAAVPFYAVPANITALLQYNPNIMDKEEAASLDSWRSSIEDLLVIFRDEDDTVDADGSRFADQITSYNDAINSDRADAADTEESTDETATDDFWQDTYVEDVTTTPTQSAVDMLTGGGM